MNYISDFIWERNLRSVNEDSLCLCHVMLNGKPLIFCAICDGVGGLDNGEVASGFVIRNLKEHFETMDLSESFHLRSMTQSILNVLNACHEELAGCATTVCAVIIFGRRCSLISCGDSRVYKGNRRLKQITFDDTDDLGRLTSCIGHIYPPRISCRSFTISFSDTLLICSDGFYRRNERLISLNPLHHCDNERSLRNELKHMYRCAVAMGERDNCTAIAIRLKREER